MAEFGRQYQTPVRGGAGVRVEGIDQGLRAFMLGVYNNMAMGLALTGIVALRRVLRLAVNGELRPSAGGLRQPAEVGHHARAAGLRFRPVGGSEPDAARARRGSYSSPSRR